MDSKENKLWLPLPPDTSDEEAKRKFAARFGVAPKEIIRQRSGLLVGPVPREKVAMADDHGPGEANR